MFATPDSRVRIDPSPCPVAEAGVHNRDSGPLRRPSPHSSTEPGSNGHRQGYCRQGAAASSCWITLSLSVRDQERRLHRRRVAQPRHSEEGPRPARQDIVRPVDQRLCLNTEASDAQDRAANSFVTRDAGLPAFLVAVPTSIVVTVVVMSRGQIAPDVVSIAPGTLAIVTDAALTRLVVLRGNSGSGKSTVSQELRRAAGRPMAWIEQDYFRRIILDEHGGELEPKWRGLVDGAVRYSLNSGHHVVLDGIFDAQRHRTMLQQLLCDYPKRTTFHRFSVPFDETLRRHARRPWAHEVSVETMRGWYTENDGLDFVEERIINAESSVDETVRRIIDENSLL